MAFFIMAENAIQREAARPVQTLCAVFLQKNVVY